MIKLTLVGTVLPAAALPFVGAVGMLVAQATNFDIFANNRLVAFCLMGSGIGALLAVAICLPSDDAPTKIYLRRIMVKFASSMLSGVAIAPMALERWGTKFGLAVDEVPTPAVTMAVSAGLAAGAVWGVHVFGPIIEKRGRRLIEKFLPAAPEDDQPPKT